MLEINKRYMRTSPIGDQSVVHIKNEEELTYQSEYISEGYTFKEIIPTVVPSGTCVSCEG